MDTKDYVYLVLIGLTAAVFYWHGYLAARSRARKSFAAIFNDRRTHVEMPSAEREQTQVVARGTRPGFSRHATRIRAVFGVN